MSRVYLVMFRQLRGHPFGKELRSGLTVCTLCIMSTCNLSRIVRKLAFCICENKDADQLRGNREADQRLCFRYTVQSLYFLNPKLQASSHLLYLYSPVCVGPVGNPEDRFSHNEAHFFLFWFRGEDCGSDCTSSWSLLTFYFSQVLTCLRRMRMSFDPPGVVSTYPGTLE